MIHLFHSKKGKSVEGNSDVKPKESKKHNFNLFKRKKKDNAILVKCGHPSNPVIKISLDAGKQYSIKDIKGLFNNAFKGLGKFESINDGNPLSELYCIVFSSTNNDKPMLLINKGNFSQVEVADDNASFLEKEHIIHNYYHSILCKALLYKVVDVERINKISDIEAGK